MLVCYESILTGESSGLLWGVIGVFSYAWHTLPGIRLIAVTGLIWLSVHFFASNSRSQVFNPFRVAVATDKTSRPFGAILALNTAWNIPQTDWYWRSILKAVPIREVSINRYGLFKFSNWLPSPSSQPFQKTLVFPDFCRSNWRESKVTMPWLSNWLSAVNSLSSNGQQYLDIGGDNVPIIPESDVKTILISLWRFDSRVIIDDHDGRLGAYQLLPRQGGLFLDLFKGIVHRYSLLSSFAGVPSDGSQGEDVNHEFQPTRYFASLCCGFFLMGYRLWYARFRCENWGGFVWSMASILVGIYFFGLGIDRLNLQPCEQCKNGSQNT